MPSPTPSKYALNSELCLRYQQGDLAAAEELLAVNAGLVHGVVRRYLPRCHHLDAEDLLQEGRLGLLRAAASYDDSRGHQFSTFDTFWIRQAIQRAVVQMDRAIRIPVNQVETKGRAWDELPRVTVSLDTPMGEDGDDAFVDLQMASDDPEAEAIARLWVDGLLATLPDDERRVLAARLRGDTLADVASRLQVSRENIRQLQIRAERAIRTRSLAG